MLAAVAAERACGRRRNPRWTRCPASARRRRPPSSLQQRLCRSARSPRPRCTSWARLPQTPPPPPSAAATPVPPTRERSRWKVRRAASAGCSRKACSMASLTQCSPRSALMLRGVCHRTPCQARYTPSSWRLVWTASPPAPPPTSAAPQGSEPLRRGCTTRAQHRRATRTLQHNPTRLPCPRLCRWLVRFRRLHRPSRQLHCRRRRCWRCRHRRRWKPFLRAGSGRRSRCHSRSCRMHEELSTL
mmetsp:Transcript_66924/g.217733  ORF Transcript_66924/g.217733 Transcript_66924/m.217733 type:complete len:244 (+) Transcript_66924:1695-2426(+)